MKSSRMTKKSLLARFWVFILLASIISSCQDEILVGGTLLDDEKLNIGEISSFNLSTQVVPGERIITHQSNIDSRTYILGQLEDPIFGKISAELFMKFKTQSTTKPNYHLEEKLRFDSLVLVLQYDTLGTYGNAKSAQSIKVFQLEDAFNEKDTFYSDTQIRYFPTEIGKAEKIVSPKDSVKIINHLTGKQVTQAPQLRIRLNDSFGEALINNEGAGKNDTLLGEFLKGVYITSTSLNNEPFTYGLNLNDAALIAQTSINKLIMYYTVKDTTEKTYEYIINSATINRFVHDRTGSQISNFITNPELADSITFMQGIGNVKTVVKFNDLSTLDTVLINKAELEITVAEIPGQNGTYSIPKQIFAIRKNSDGKFVFIDDIAQPLSGGVSYVTSFGGAPFTSGSLRKYKINITNHIKNAVKDKSLNSDIYLSVPTEAENPSRAIFYGAKHSQYPVKLKVTYTKI